MSDPTSLAEQALRDIHGLRTEFHGFRGDFQAMRPTLDRVAEQVGRFDERFGAVVKTSNDQAEQIRALTEARERDRTERDRDRAEVAQLRLEVAQYKAANALPMKAVIALGALILLAVGGVVVNNAVKPAAPQIIVQQPASVHP